MTTHSQQLSATPATRRAIAATDGPTFTELVYAHYDWWHNRHNGNATDSDAAYRDVLHRFEQHHGRIVDSFWCTNLESGVALTERKRRFPLRPARSFHRESDWATKQSPLIASELHRCDELAIRAQTVLTGVRQRICLHLVAAAAAHLLSLVDKLSSPEVKADLRSALKEEQQALARAERYYQEAANGQAEIVYFAGMAAVAVAVALSAGLFLRVEWKVGVAALVAGAAGAVVSVIQRINARSFHVNYDVGRPYAFFLGGLRPLIGGAFAIAVAFAFASGMLHLPIAGTNKEHEHLALVVLSFLAGFSERFAQDTLASVLPQAQQESPAPAAPSS